LTAEACIVWNLIVAVFSAPGANSLPW